MPLPTVYQLFKKLLTRYGEQNWWPGDSPFEVMVGAILTQNTSWINVEKAIEKLKDVSALNATKLLATPHEMLADWLRPVGYFNVKATRLRNFCQWFIEAGDLQKLQNQDTHSLRQNLLAVKGIGPETADDILLYAFDRPVFVIDAYTRRLFQRLGYIDDNPAYEELRMWFEEKLRRVAGKVQVFNEYHALIVHHAKYFCKSKPECSSCCLNSICKSKTV